MDLFVTPEETSQDNESINRALEFRKHRYEANYSHWESWVPDDAVSKEEVLVYCRFCHYCIARSGKLKKRRKTNSTKNSSETIPTSARILCKI